MVTFARSTLGASTTTSANCSNVRGLVCQPVRPCVSKPSFPFHGRCLLIGKMPFILAWPNRFCQDAGSRESHLDTRTQGGIGSDDDAGRDAEGRAR